MIQRDNQILTYDSRQRLANVTEGAAVTDFGYDYSGKRLWRDNGSVSVWIAPHFEVREGRSLCHVFVGSKRIVTFEPTDSVMGGGHGMGFGLGLGDTALMYYHGDHLNGTNLVTDETGAVVQRDEYEVFGEVRFEIESAVIAADNLYTDQLLDRSTGLYYYGARYYDPEISRFIQPDPVEGLDGDPQTLNPYTYTLNNPLRYVDPDGAVPSGPHLNDYTEPALLLQLQDFGRATTPSAVWIPDLGIAIEPGSLSGKAAANRIHAKARPPRVSSITETMLWQDRYEYTAEAASWALGGPLGKGLGIVGQTVLRTPLVRRAAGFVGGKARLVGNAAGEFASKIWKRLRGGADDVVEEAASRSLHIADGQFGKKLGRHAAEFGLDPSNAKDRQTFRGIIEGIASSPDKVVSGTFRGQGSVNFLIKGSDVVVSKGGEFVTILKGGINNPSVQSALSP